MTGPMPYNQGSTTWRVPQTDCDPKSAATSTVGIAPVLGAGVKEGDGLGSGDTDKTISPNSMTSKGIARATHTPTSASVKFKGMQ
jgi:hypothetical protein